MLQHFLVNFTLLSVYGKVPLCCRHDTQKRLNHQINKKEIHKQQKVGRLIAATDVEIPNDGNI